VTIAEKEGKRRADPRRARLRQGKKRRGKGIVLPNFVSESLEKKKKSDVPRGPTITFPFEGEKKRKARKAEVVMLITLGKKKGSS